MSTIPRPSSPAVPSIRILDADNSALFDPAEAFPTDIYTFYNLVDDTGFYTCPQSVQQDYLPANAIPPSSAELEDIPELSHLTTTNQMYLTGHGYSLPYPAILPEPGATASADRGLSPSSLGSPIPSPTSSFASSLSPSSLYGSLALSDGDLPVPASPTMSEQHFLWPPHGSHHQSSDSLASYPLSGSFSNDSVLHSSLDLQTSSRRPRSKSSPTSRLGPVASKAMLEANSRRRRHPAQHGCPDCGQTFTALFSLKRHAQSHTGERPFACSIPGCAQRFFNSSDCKRHEKSRKRHKDLLML